MEVGFPQASTYSEHESLRLPSHMTAGSQFLLLATDRDGESGGTTFANNVRAVPIELVAPNLTVANVTAPDTAAAGESLLIEWTVSNASDSVAHGAGPIAYIFRQRRSCLGAHNNWQP